MGPSTVTCKNCGNVFTGKYCNSCGEKIYKEEDKSAAHLLEEGLHFTTHLDGTLFATLKAIFKKPGQLSLDYCNGLRKKYFKPLSFFLLLVILYLLFPVFEGLNMKLNFHLTNNLYGKYALAEVVSILEKRHITEQELAQSFHHAGEKTSKFLLFIIIPFVALISRLLGFWKRRYYFDHFIFTTEICSFFILWGFLILPFLLRVYHWVTGKYIPLSDAGSGILVISVFIIYVSIAAGRFFKFKWWYRILYALLLSVFLSFFIAYIYKFILFFISIHLV